jgi:hypothetical protein
MACILTIRALGLIYIRSENEEGQRKKKGRKERGDIPWQERLAEAKAPGAVVALLIGFRVMD